MFSVCVFVCMCVSGTHVQLHYWLNVRAAMKQLCPSARMETLGPQAPDWAPVAGQQCPGLELQEAVSASNVP